MATALQLTNELGEISYDRPQTRRMARLFFATFWLIIFTGAIRKWVFPNLTALYLLQDVPITMAYIYALVTGLYARSLVLIGICILSVILVLQALLQIILIGLSPFTAAVGLHHYLYYLPMLIVFSVILDAKNRRDFIRWNLLLAIPMSVLGLAQSLSPSTAFVNRSSAGGAMIIPEGGISRGTGTFNFTAFYALWLGLAFALCVGEWLQPQGKRNIQNRLLLFSCTAALLIATLVSAERTAIGLMMVALVGGAIAAGLLGSTRPLVAISLILVLLPVGAGVTALISPAEFTSITNRITDSDNISDTKVRIRDMIIGFLEVDFNPIGAGIGMGVDAAHVGETGGYDATYNLSEMDITRTVMELGTFVGLLYAFVRIGFFAGMLLLAVYLVRKRCSPHVLPLALVLFVTGYGGDMTRNSTMTSTQLMLGCAFILGVFYFPDNDPAILASNEEIMMRTA